jgi:hypothetical protein
MSNSRFVESAPESFCCKIFASGNKRSFHSNSLFSSSGGCRSLALSSWTKRKKFSNFQKKKSDKLGPYDCYFHRHEIQENNSIKMFKVQQSSG